jgi:hypothetical protein
MRKFLVFPYSEKAGLATSWIAGVARGWRHEQNSTTEAVGCILDAVREAKTEILVHYEFSAK